METKPPLGKPVKTTLAAITQINDPSISDAKRYLLPFRNKYTLEPHVTYAICPIPRTNLRKIEKVLDTFFSHKRKFKIKLGKLSYDPKGRFFYLPIKGPALLALHSHLTRMFNQFRDGRVREEDQEKYMANLLTFKEIRYIKRYGYKRVFGNFIPHLTIGNILEGVSEAAVKRNLQKILNSSTTKGLEVSCVQVSLNLDFKNQSDMKSLWLKEYRLK